MFVHYWHTIVLNLSFGENFKWLNTFVWLNTSEVRLVAGGWKNPQPRLLREDLLIRRKATLFVLSVYTYETLT